MARTRLRATRRELLRNRGAPAVSQRRGSHDVSDHTLVTPAAGKLIELLNRLDFDFYLSLARKAKDVFDALILTSALNENTRHTLRMTFQQGAH